MNYLVTFSNRACSSSKIPPLDAANGSTRLNDITLDFLKSYLGVNDLAQLEAIAKQSFEKASIQKLFEELCEYASAFFGTKMSLNLEMRENTIAISQSEDKIYMNTLMSSAFLSYIATQIYHSYVLDTFGANSEESKFCYRYTLFILNDMCFNDFKQPVIFPNEDSLHSLISRMKDKPTLLEKSGDIFYSSIAFALLHEISHAYLKHDESIIDLQKEIEADEKAYLIFLNLCDDIQNNRLSSIFHECLKEYTYMAPMYLLEFYYVVYYTGSFLCPYHPAAEKQEFENIVLRKKALFDVFYAWDRDVNPDQSYDLYNCYLDSTESFLRSFVASDKAGMLDVLKERNYNRRHD